jgi:hypothetical protein
MIRMLLVGYCYGIWSERRLCARGAEYRAPYPGLGQEQARRLHADRAGFWAKVCWGSR